ncbi:MAG: bifunctional 4-hydroxy-2-oxoglutarate aldolase/2-dehydro-3-deoxy-phosphogluconate aldolase [Synechococcaceae cyanobacterium SM2_3_1]|nr:bifunctional 4-hydroxy-2-oxoglutarate aldolase/2-dehydro-3-deoxy-phosphogluconate aldolase [Synechococcaceae cyanobacterium SM2_3_1]
MSSSLTVRTLGSMTCSSDRSAAFASPVCGYPDAPEVATLLELQSPEAQVRGRLTRLPLIAIIRQPDPALAVHLADLTVQAGIIHIEITTQVQDFAEVIQQLRRQYAQAWIGAGTVLQDQQAQAALQAGAQFLVSPLLLPSVIHLAQEANTVVIAGALTPQEIWAAFQAGATAVKVFPVESMGGAAYLRRLCKPLGRLPLIPTGGVTLANGAEFLHSGALAIGVGGDLYPAALIRAQQWPQLQQHMQAGLRQLLADGSSSVEAMVESSENAHQCRQNQSRSGHDNRWWE